MTEINKEFKQELINIKLKYNENKIHTQNKNDASNINKSMSKSNLKNNNDEYKIKNNNIETIFIKD